MNDHDLPEDEFANFQRRGEEGAIRDMMQKNKAILGDRKMIVKFSKGGRVHEEHFYESDSPDHESQVALSMVLNLAGREGIGPQIIGKGFRSFIAPWEWLQFTQGGLPTSTATWQFEVHAPIRVADVIEQPNGVVIVVMEASG